VAARSSNAPYRQALDLVHHRLGLGVTLGSGEEMLPDVHVVGTAVDGASIVTIWYSRPPDALRRLAGI
jgi:hypothetical protein